jgi:hypothetical protein
MSSVDDSAVSLVALIQRRAPEYLDLLTAEADADFEKAFDALLEKAVSGLERNKKNLEKLDEVGLSGVLALALSVPGLAVIQEAHSNGHVDLTIEADHCVPARKKLGEAKIYDGPEYHMKGLEQLLGRYSTGREGRGLLIVYFRKQNIAGLITKLRARMDSDQPCQQQGKTVDHFLKWSFLSTHTLNSGDNHEVGHVGCNLCTD